MWEIKRDKIKRPHFENQTFTERIHRANFGNEKCI